MEPGVSKKVEENSVYFILRWSCIKKVDKFEIISRVPSMPGIFELYFMDNKKKLNLFFLARAYYGGLRYMIRKRTDPELEDDCERRKILNSYTCYYRYTVLQSYGDMSDILYFFKQTYCLEQPGITDSGRYEHIFVEEKTDDKIITI